MSVLPMDVVTTPLEATIASAMMVIREMVLPAMVSTHLFGLPLCTLKWIIFFCKISMNVIPSIVVIIPSV